MKIAAVIPAREGSKRIPNKCRLEINGELLISKVIKNLEKTDLIDDIYVSTDDNFLINSLGDSCKLLKRPKSLSDDYSTVIDVLKHHAKKELIDYDYILQVFVHSICIDSATYETAINNLINSKKSFLISASKLPVPVEWTLKIDKDSIVPVFEGKELMRSQDLGNSYYDSGQFYIYKQKWFSNDESMDYSQGDYLLIRAFQSMDLDEEEDMDTLRVNYQIALNTLKNLS